MNFFSTHHGSCNFANTVVDVARYCNTGYSNIGGCRNLYQPIGYL